MPAPAIIAAASGLWRSLTGDEKKAEGLQSALSAVFGAEQNLHIALDDFAEPLHEAAGAASLPARRGGAGETAWLEWRFAEGPTLGPAHFGETRWRFYASGLIVFNGVMATARGGLDGGDLLGHRIELATTDGLTVGAFLAGFFVRAEVATERYVSTAQIAHAALARHFDELAEAQAGLWFRRA